MRLNPLTAKKLRRFRQIRRGYLSLTALLVMVGMSLLAELFINNKALAFDEVLYFILNNK